jgi:ATP-binding cassette subfamily F protein 3
MLGEFEGTLLFVSHDRYFIDRLATKVWAIEDGELRCYLGNYTEYRTRKQQIMLQPVAANSKTAKGVAEKKKSTSSVASKSPAKKGTKARTVEDVEKDIERAETHAQSLEGALSEAALQADAMRLTQLSLEYEQAKAQVEELFAEWERLVDVAS